jgi:AcrR family transcriptional regulator
MAAAGRAGSGRKRSTLRADAGSEGSDKRVVLLAIAEKLFSARGYRDVSIEDITREAGLGIGSFYSFFKGKEELYTEILDNLERGGAEEAERHVRKFNSPLNKLKALYRFSALGLKGNPILRGMITRDRRFLYPGTEARSSRPGTLMSTIERILDDILTVGAQKRVFRTDLFQNAKRMLLAVYNSILMEPDPQRSTELMNDVLRLIERGIRRRFRLAKRDERLDRRLLRRKPANE